MPVPSPDNVQGLVARRYAYPQARHHLFTVTDPVAARASLAGWLAQVTRWSTPLEGRPEPLLNIGLTWRGLVALLPPERVADAAAAFPPDFRDPPPPTMAGSWKGRMDGRNVHVVVSLHCHADAALAAASREVRRTALGLCELRPEAEGDGAVTAHSLPGRRKLHFGFTDGISEPSVNWTDEPGRAGLVDLRNFVLGYASDKVQSFPRTGPWADLVRDGSYGAFQWLRLLICTES